jgi:hypothetical protein
MTPSEMPDLDLIHQVQQARMQHDQTAQPSQIGGVYWIEAKAPFGPAPTAHTAYWQVTTRLDQVDTLWAKIKSATEAGLLGYKAKVATASHTGDSDSRSIQVFSYDRHDEADSDRIRAALASLDLPGQISYHQD